MTLSLLRSKPAYQLLAVIVLVALGSAFNLSDDRLVRSIGLLFPILMGALALWQIQIVRSKALRVSLAVAIGLSILLFAALMAGNVWVALTAA
jgi:predicted membrane channel-forming protein YqfA (hemolysin III family)